jgi:hypothetical protein
MDERGAERLSDYLAVFAERLRRALWLRAAALLALLALGLTIAGSALVIRTGFGSGTLALVRVGLLLVLALAALVLLVRPLQRLRRARATAVESLTGEFEGRLHTFAQLPESHPFRELLASDALGIAERHPPHAHVRRARLLVPAALAAALALGLLWLAALGPGLYRDGARAIWVGWLLPHLLPAQRLDVDPGDQAVRRGADITVRSRAEGFAPVSARLYVRVGSGAWQVIDMPHDRRAGVTGQSAAARTRGSPDSRSSRTSGGTFAFTFFSLRDSVSYYVAAAGVRSPTYRLSVVDVPNLEGLRLTYHYPEWTGRADRIQQGDGDISAIAGTRVTLQLHTDRPLGTGELVLDAGSTALDVHGRQASGELTVSHDARYYLAALIGRQRVRLTDDFLIKVLPVPPPQVHISWPGRDYSASSIEEVSTDVSASDPYGLHALELHYSVNGGSWHTVNLPLPANAAQSVEGTAHAAGASLIGTSQDITDHYLFSLESLRADRAARSLAAGDLVSYYAVARGHTLSSQSDLYFIDVQPFDRRYSQSQTAGGGGAGGGADEQQEISRRQREILVSTWNLLRQRQQAAGPPSASIHDNAALLASLQGKLAAQAQTLAERTQARQLVSADPRIARFIDSMRQAAKAMQPAAVHLAATDLGSAVAPEQQALQYLMRAASQFTDVQVALQRGGGGGGGDQSGRDLSQIYQLEMDLHKNQYESGSGATPQSRDRQADELARRLHSLAQRQQQLAEQMQSHPLTPEQRWQQQSLQREAEDLRQQLAQLQQSAQQGQQNGSPQNGTQSASSRSRANGQGSAGQASGSGTTSGSASGGGALGGGPPPSSLARAQSSPGNSSGTNSSAANAGGTQNDLLAQRLNAAVQAMQRATQAMGGDSAAAAEQARRAAQQAQQALSGAGTELARERAQVMQQQVAELAARAEQLYHQQADTQQRLLAALRSQADAGAQGARGKAASEGAGASNRADGGRSGPFGPFGPFGPRNRLGPSSPWGGPRPDELSEAQRAQLTDQTRQLSAGVQRLGDEAAASAEQYRRDAPATAAALNSAANAVNEPRPCLTPRFSASGCSLVDQLDAAAQYINEGAARDIAPGEGALTDALRELRDRLQAAQAAAGQAALAANAPADPVTDELARLRALRSQLQQNANAAQLARNGAAPAQAAGGGRSSQGVARGAAGAANGAGAGGLSGGGLGGLLAGGVGGLGGLGALDDGRRTVATGAAALVPLLRAQGVDAASLDRIARLSRQLQEGLGTGREGPLAEQLRGEITLLDQLELQLTRRGQSEQAIRAAVANRGAERYQEAVAEYYRQLSRQ